MEQIAKTTYLSVILFIFILTFISPVNSANIIIPQEVIKNDDIAEVKKAINNGADVNARYEFGHTALMLAVENNALSVAKLLIENGAEINTKGPGEITALIMAIGLRNSDFARFLIENGAEVNSKSEGITPLMVATMSGDLDIVRLLLTKGADVNMKDPDGYTALMIASEGNSLELVRLLLENSADADAKDKEGATALTYAKLNGSKEIIQLLKKYSSVTQASQLYKAQPEQTTNLLTLESVKDILAKAKNIDSVQYEVVATVPYPSEVDGKIKDTTTIISKNWEKPPFFRSEGPMNIILHQDAAYSVDSSKNLFKKIDSKKFIRFASLNFLMELSKEISKCDDLKVLGAELIDGKLTTVIEAEIIIIKEKDRPPISTKYQFWIWNDKGIPLKGVSVKDESVFYYRNFVFGNVPDSIFEVPKDKIID